MKPKGGEAIKLYMYIERDFCETDSKIKRRGFLNANIYAVKKKVGRRQKNRDNNYWMHNSL